MRNYLILIFLPIVLFFIFVLSVGSAFAQNEIATKSSEAVVTKSDYNLPYPGILPDNPLYFLKAFRDKVVSFLINDSVKKAEFNLLTSDKRIAAAQSLLDKDKKELSITTISKSTNYFFNAVASVQEAKKTGKETGGILTSLSASVKKHIEVLENMQKIKDNNFKEDLQREEARLEELAKLVDEIKTE